MAETIIFLAGKNWHFEIPSEQNLRSYPLHAFSGERHYISVAVPGEDEVYAYRNLAFNPIDQNKKEDAYPHAVANVETRNEATFFPIDKRLVEWVEVKELIKADDESPFPALSQLEVYGKYVK